MCGLAGVLGAGPADRDALERALQAIRHRGPDELNVWTEGGAGLAHARLSIIDRAHGSQPMTTPDGRYVVAFNGEIYNHHELRADLVRRGYPMRTACDTEILPSLYAADGPAMVERLRRPSGMVFGNYLVVSYYEAKAAGAQDGCCTESSPPLAKAKGGCGCGCASPATCTCGSASSAAIRRATTSWPGAGTTRIRADPILDFQGTWPTRASGKIVLAQLDLNAQCQVVQVLTGMRQYTSGMQPPKVRALSLEGEKDIDHDNPKVLFFDIDGANPESVVLKLWATKFSTLYYTEMARHTHLIVGNTEDITHDFAHSHTPSGDTSASGGHNHEYFCDDKNNAPRCFVVTQPDGDSGKPPGLPQILPVGDHVHNLGTLKLTTDLGSWTHHHKLPAAVADTGVLVLRDSQASYGYVDDLRIELDGVDITPLVVAHLNGLNPGKWLKLGDGTAVHSDRRQGRHRQCRRAEAARHRVPDRLAQACSASPRPARGRPDHYNPTSA